MKINLLGVDCLVEEYGTNQIKIICNQYNPQLIGELRELDSFRFKNNAFITCRDNSRNCFVIDFLSSGQFTGQSRFYRQFTSTNILIGGIWEHQQRAFEFKINRRRCIDAGEMGIGKTLSTLEAMHYFIKNFGWTGQIWWIGPNSGLTALRTQLVKFNRSSLFACGRGKIQNYHSLERLMEETSDPPQIVVFDECHALKNSSSRRTQLAIQLSEEMERYWKNDCSVIGLTGTPAPENHFDWWSICEVVRPGWLKESTFNKFKYRLANFELTELQTHSFPKFIGWKQHEVDILPKRLEKLVLVTWKKDCLDLPEKIYEIIECPPSEEALRVARLIRKSGGRAIEIHQKLRQLSDGFQYITNEDGRQTHVATSPKEQVVRELLESFTSEESNGRIVLYGAYQASADKLIQICLEEGWNVWAYDGRGQRTYLSSNSTNKLLVSTITESIFQNTKKYPQPIAFVGNTEAAGQGLTLTPSAAIIYYSNSFKSQYRVQSEDRIHRPGASKERGCRIIDIIHLPTDRIVLERIKEKRDVEEDTLEKIDKVL